MGKGGNRPCATPGPAVGPSGWPPPLPPRSGAGGRDGAGAEGRGGDPGSQPATLGGGGWLGGAQAGGPGGGERRGGRLKAVIQDVKADAPRPGGGGAKPKRHRLSRSSSASDMVELGLSAAELDRLKGVQPAGAAETGTRHPLELVSCALMGVVFGIALEKGRVVDPIAMQGQFIFRRWFMMKFFFSGVASSMMVFAACSWLFPDRFRLIRSDKTGCGERLAKPLAGGLLLGAGMAVAASCPGSIAPQIGGGLPNSGWVLLGSVLGALVNGLVEPVYRKWVTCAACDEKYAFADKLAGQLLGREVGPLALYAAFIPFLLGFLAFLEWIVPWTDDIPASWTEFRPNVLAMGAWPATASGCLLGVIQIPTIIFNRETIGCSTSFDTIVGQWVRFVPERTQELFPTFTNRLKVPAPQALSQPVYLVSAVLGGYISSTASGVHGHVPGLQSIIMCIAGGFIMVFGARLGNGCTSGHGISGFGCLSIPSILATMGLFSGAIGTTFVLLWLGQVDLDALALREIAAE